MRNQRKSKDRKGAHSASRAFEDLHVVNLVGGCIRTTITTLVVGSARAVPGALITTRPLDRHDWPECSVLGIALRANIAETPHPAKATASHWNARLTGTRRTVKQQDSSQRINGLQTYGAIGVGFHEFLLRA